MLKILRLVVLGLLLLLWFLFGFVYVLVRPRHRNNVHLLGRLLNRLSPVLGVKVKFTLPTEPYAGPAVYVANHQTNWDIIVETGAVMPGTVSVGKKSLFWIPLFGILYYLSGNILIDRSNRSRAIDTILQVVDRIRGRKISVWMFPEGTRSQGRGLLPFKTGAFHTAMQARVPMIPVVCSSYVGQIDLNRWDNGEILVEMLPPVDTSGWEREQLREHVEQLRELMTAKLAELDAKARRPA